MCLNENPGDRIILRKLLGQLFGLFRAKRLNDAGDGLLSILECLPNIEKCFPFHFNFSGHAFLAITRKQRNV